jgi:hypothetical protein
MRRIFPCLLCVGAVLTAPTAHVGFAQSAAPTAAPAAASDKPLLKPEELEQLVAPIALYPDSLLTQVLMASTYPLEIVQADRWQKANKDLKGDALSDALAKQPWDASVKSLINFPDVLSMMSDQLDLTVKLGDAFLDQQGDVLNTVQKLRGKAQACGNLKSNEQVTVAVAPAPAPDPQTVVVQQVAPPPQIITIASPSPTVVYVPTYNPTVVYGTWPYPAYPPAPYYPPRPPGYVATSVISFGVGVALGAAWGNAWGNCNWGHGDVNINVNRNANFNSANVNNINRNNVNNANVNRNNVNNASVNGGGSTWKHDPSHRGGVAYPNQATAQKYGGANQSAQAAQARDAYRGRTDTGFSSPSAGAQNRTGAGVSNNAAAGGQNRPSPAVQNNAAAGAQNRPSPAAQNRPSSTPSASNASRGNAFSGAGGSGSAANAASQRGQASRGGGGAARGGGGRR